NPHINYTFADIEKYLLDMLSPKERHQLEKAALQDPFLGDAIEGYENTFLTAAKEHLTSIDTKIISQEKAEEYTLSDIENYLQGNMTAAEMHAIEKEALKDPFLADAMEGYEEMGAAKTSGHLHIATDETETIEATIPNYNFNDIEQYLDGNMTSQESHLIEKTALKEPFLSDAIDGFEQTNLDVAKQYLINIETAILGEEKKATKVVSMNPSSSNKIWLRIAAAILLIVGVGSTIWMANKKGNSSITAYVKPAIIKQDPSSATLPNHDDSTTNSIVEKNKTSINQTSPTTLPTTKTEAAGMASKDKKILEQTKIDNQVTEVATASMQKDHAKKETEILAGKMQGVEIKDNTVLKGKDATRNAIFDSSITASQVSRKEKYNTTRERNAAAGMPNEKSTSNNQLTNELRGRVINTQGEGLPYATLNLNRENRRYQSMLSDANGNFNIPATDTMVNATVEVPGYDQQNITLNASRNNTVVLGRRDATLSEEIVTTRIGTKKKLVESILGTPVGGLKSFEDYVSKKKESMKKDSTDDEVYVESLVELEFDVDKLGRPYNIAVIKSNGVDDSINSRAVQIVKEGPRWIADKKKKKAKVSIKF
ncbi:MAG: carboxypeptidase regulatory-like domain-containing protein, partial [Chitinophagaceae bacterium]|nr:carboxypeptidase regulatory-like domain-containing protein [Chitinophagaceae bacterium]